MVKALPESSSQFARDPSARDGWALDPRARRACRAEVCGRGEPRSPCSTWEASGPPPRVVLRFTLGLSALAIDFAVHIGARLFPQLVPARVAHQSRGFDQA